MKKKQFLGIVRHTLTFIGGIMVMKGTLDENTMNEMIGSITTLAGLIWSVIDKE